MARKQSVSLLRFRRHWGTKMDGENRRPIGEGLPAIGRLSSALDGLCQLVCQLALLGMVGIGTVEIIARSLFSRSTYMSDEVSGYLLVMITFMALASCNLRGSFSTVEVIIDRLPSRAAAFLQIMFDFLGLFFGGLLFWKLTTFEIASFRSGSVSPTLLAIPLWVPQLAMAVGMFLYLVAIIVALLAHARQFISGGMK